MKAHGEHMESTPFNGGLKEIASFSQETSGNIRENGCDHYHSSLF